MNRQFLQVAGRMIGNINLQISTHFQQLTTLRNAYALKKPQNAHLCKLLKKRNFENAISH